MNAQIIQKRLDSYGCTSEIEEEHAIREITQEVILAALGRTDFFNHTQFQGGTCLRVFSGLNRFSEDLDFMLNEPKLNFNLGHYLEPTAQELRAYGYDPEVTDRVKTDSAFQKAFRKDDSLGKILQMQFPGNSRSRKKIKIKLEVDTNPPVGSVTEVKYIDFPYVSSVVIQDMPSLFAGKIHGVIGLWRR